MKKTKIFTVTLTKDGDTWYTANYETKKKAYAQYLEVLNEDNDGSVACLLATDEDGLSRELETGLCGAPAQEEGMKQTTEQVQEPQVLALRKTEFKAEKKGLSPRQIFIEPTTGYCLIMDHGKWSKVTEISYKIKGTKECKKTITLEELDCAEYDGELKIVYTAQEPVQDTPAEAEQRHEAIQAIEKAQEEIAAAEAEQEPAEEPAAFDVF